MGKIKILDESVSNIIAAGEVVENPTALLKELIENSLDAGATSILINVENSGRNITISDNGSGMDEEDLLLSIERHATSKISKKEDLFNLNTYGFRGEALSSIAAVSKMSIKTKSENSEVGKMITSLGGKITSLKDVNCERGTEISVQELFFNTPARLKFLRKPTTEYSNIKELVALEALVRYNVSFKLTIDGRESVVTSGRSLENAIVEIFSSNTLKNLTKFQYGYLGNSTLSKNNKDSIFIYVNNRIVKSKLIESAIIDSYDTLLMSGKYPFAIIFIEVNPEDVDVNVHPSKKIVKFSNDVYIYSQVKNKILEVINKSDVLTSRDVELKSERNEANRDEVQKDKSEILSYIEENNKILNSLTVADSERYSEKVNLENFFKEVSQDQKLTVKEDKDFIKQEEFEKEEKEEIVKEEENPVKELNTIANSNLFQNKENIKIFSSVPQYRIIGQFLNSYILVEKDGVLEIYDQHIVHERILFEEYKEKFLKKQLNSQLLLSPLKITLTQKEKDLILENSEILKEFGLEIEELNKELLLRSAPLFPFKVDLKSLLFEILENLVEFKGRDPREEIIITMSCKGAIKANQKLTIEEMELLISRLHFYGHYTCPHGRPIILKLTLDEIEKKIKRK